MNSCIIKRWELHPANRKFRGGPGRFLDYYEQLGPGLRPLSETEYYILRTQRKQLVPDWPCDFCGLRYPAESYGVDWFDTTELNEVCIAFGHWPCCTACKEVQNRSLQCYRDERSSTLIWTGFVVLYALSAFIFWPELIKFGNHILRSSRPWDARIA